MTIAVFHPTARCCHLPQGGTVQAAGDWQVGQPLELAARNNDNYLCSYRAYPHTVNHKIINNANIVSILTNHLHFPLRCIVHLKRERESHRNKGRAWGNSRE